VQRTFGTRDTATSAGRISVRAFGQWSLATGHRPLATNHRPPFCTLRATAFRQLESMMTKRLSTREVRAHFSELVGGVNRTQEPVIVERNGKPMAAIVSPQQLATIERAKARAWAAMEQTWKQNSDADPDELMREVTEEVELVRQERYDDRRRRTTGDH
jgi:prevent-host-death family protein